ncbi:protein glass-like, partial [Tropilaelaps mercedesae]
QVPACTGTAGGVCSNSCTVCGRFYARSSTLKTHFRVHSGERPYACLQCLKRFSQAANLTAHMRIHSGEKPFLCPVCHRKFSQSSSVTTHMRTHSGERPYACSLCKKSFSDSSTLTKHFRTHSGERPYQFGKFEPAHEDPRAEKRVKNGPAKKGFAPVEDTIRGEVGCPLLCSSSPTCQVVPQWLVDFSDRSSHKSNGPYSNLPNWGIRLKLGLRPIKLIWALRIRGSSTVGRRTVAASQDQRSFIRFLPAV